jgi:hypothetical protein
LDVRSGLEAVAIALVLAGCASESRHATADGGGADDAAAPPRDAGAIVVVGDDGGDAAFALGGEWSGPCQAATGAIDVNLGNSPEAFVRAAYCQIAGAEPPAATVMSWAGQLRTVETVRRIDVVRTLCAQQNKSCALAYSNPWQNELAFTQTCTKKAKRDVGAVMMFFFTCPADKNCGLDWANTHAWGMKAPDAIYAFGAQPDGYYVPTNAGFWQRELLDARYAGLQLVMPNVYGPDVQDGTGEVPALEAALDAVGGGIQVGLFNDTWAWGKPYWGNLMQPAPDLSNTEAAAQRIYAVQWKPFFGGIAPAHWYRIGGQPLVYFYNAGTLAPKAGAGAVIARMKQLFQADFGVTPFVVVDHGYGPTPSADAQFTWDTFTNFPMTHFGTTTTASGLTLANAMVKWDSLGRDQPGAIATPATRIVKSPDILGQVLAATASSDLLLLETWNDLGEGTGITRNYDYYAKGQWLTPDAFMRVIRASQCSN